MSSEDIPKGTHWGAKLASELEGTHSGIICLVPGNLAEPWLNFEAGAFSQSIVTALIHPFLVGVEPDELPAPLPSSMQRAIRKKDHTRKLIHALNAAAVESSLPTDKVDRSFNVCWPNLENRLNCCCLMYRRVRQERGPDDVIADATKCKGDQILAIPTLVRKLPEPMRRIIGNLSNTERVLAGVDLKVT